MHWRSSTINLFDAPASHRVSQFTVPSSQFRLRLPSAHHLHQSLSALPSATAAHRADSFEHLLHLEKLLQHPIDFFHRSPAALRDPLAAAAVDERVVAALS